MIEQGVKIISGGKLSKAWVNSDTGNDQTAIINQQSRPFRTIQKALDSIKDHGILYLTGNFEDVVTDDIERKAQSCISFVLSEGSSWTQAENISHSSQSFEKILTTENFKDVSYHVYGYVPPVPLPTLPFDSSISRNVGSPYDAYFNLFDNPFEGFYKFFYVYLNEDLEPLQDYFSNTIADQPGGNGYGNSIEIAGRDVSNKIAVMVVDAGNSTYTFETDSENLLFFLVENIEVGDSYELNPNAIAFENLRPEVQNNFIDIYENEMFV